MLIEMGKYEMAIKSVITLNMIVVIYLNTLSDQSIHEGDKEAWHFFKALWLLILGLAPLPLFGLNKGIIWQDYVYSILCSYMATRFLFFDALRNWQLGENIDYIGITSKYGRFLRRVLMKQPPLGYLVLRVFVYGNYMALWWFRYEPGVGWHIEKLGFYLFYGIFVTVILIIIIVNLIKTSKHGTRNTN